MASLQRRGRLLEQEPNYPLLRSLAWSFSGAFLSLAVLVLVWLPTLVLLSIKNGMGDPVFPIVEARDGRYDILPLWKVGLLAIVIVAAWALLINMLAQLSVSLTGYAWPSGALMATISYIALARGAESPGVIATLDLPELIGGATYLPSLLGFRSAVPEAMAFLLLSGAVLAAGLLLVASFSEGPRGFGFRMSKIGEASPVPRHYSSEPGERGRHSRKAPWLPCKWVLRVLLHDATMRYVLLTFAAILGILLICGGGADASPYERETYRPTLVQLSELESSLATGSDEREEMEQLRGSLASFVYSSDDLEGMEALANYEQQIANMIDEGAIGLDLAGEDATLARARGELLSHLVQRGDTVRSSVGSMPGVLLVSYSLGSIPSAVWLIPSFGLAAASVALTSERRLLGQVPLPQGALLLSGMLVSSVLSLLSVALALFSIGLFGGALNRGGDLSYPVVCIAGERVVSSTVLSAIARTVVLLALCSVFISAFVQALGRLGGTRAIVIGTLVLLMAAPLLEAVAHVRLGPMSAIALHLPFVYLDFARVTGYSSCDIPVLNGASWECGVAVLILSIVVCIVGALAIMRARERRLNDYRQ